MSSQPLAVVKSSVIRTHMMTDKASYPEQVDVLFITAPPAPSTVTEA